MQVPGHPNEMERGERERVVRVPGQLSSSRRLLSARHPERQLLELALVAFLSAPAGARGHVT